MKFLLVAPPKKGLAGHEESIPIGLGYLATTLRKLGHEPDLKDCLIRDWDNEALLSYIRRSKPDIVGITVYSQALRNVREILEMVKKENPGIITIVGGPHPTGVPEHALRFLECADFGINGEGEIPLQHLMPILEKGEGRYEDVPGLIWREKGHIRWNQKVEYDNLDELGFPAWDLIDPPSYFDSPDFKGKVTIIHTTRGCPYGCAFCVKLGRKLRYHSIEKIYEQIRLLHERYGVIRFLIGDEGFPINPKFLKDFCRYVIAQGDNFSYMAACGLRLNAIDDEMCELLKQANFSRMVGIGIEAGSERVRKLMNKNLPTEVIFRGVEILNRHGFKPAANFIIGFPGETREEVEETIRLARKLKIWAACFAPFIPLPGSVATNKLIADGEIPADFDYSLIDLDCVLYAPKGMTKKEVDDLRKKAVFLFNIQPRMLWYHMTGGRLKWSIIKVFRIFFPMWLVPRPWRKYIAQ